MKRLLTLVLALAMVLSLAACGSKKTVQLTADGGAVVVLSADANNAVTSLSVAFRKQLAAKLGGEVQLNYDNKLDEKASGTRVLIGQTSQGGEHGHSIPSSRRRAGAASVCWPRTVVSPWAARTNT